MSFKSLTLTAVLFSLVANSSYAQQNTGKGAVIGGVTGAVIGGLVGKQTQKTTGGALIGGAVGAVAGGVLGRAQDNEMARREYAYQQSMYNQQQQFYVQQQVQQQAAVQSGVSTADVVSMSRTGINDAVIMGQIQSRGVQRKLEVSDIISLHQQGVSDTVISAMQAAQVSGQGYGQQVGYQQPVVVRQAPTVIVKEPVYYSSSPVVIERYHSPRPYCATAHYGYRF